MIGKALKLPEIPCESIAALRIKALYNTYKGEVAEIYCQTVSGKVTAVISRLVSGFTLLTLGDADFEELDSFFSYLSGEVFCDKECAERLKPIEKNIYCGLQYHGQIPKATNGEQVKLREVYPLLKLGSDGDIDLPEFEDWYTDFCLRVNHLSADYYVLNGAVAVAGFMTDSSALITGVAVDKSCRKRGLGSKALNGLIVKLNLENKRQIFAVANGKTTEFYKKNGFEEIGSYAVLKY